MFLEQKTALKNFQFLCNALVFRRLFRLNSRFVQILFAWCRFVPHMLCSQIQLSHFYLVVVRTENGIGWLVFERILTLEMRKPALLSNAVFREAIIAPLWRVAPGMSWLVRRILRVASFDCNLRLYFVMKRNLLLENLSFVFRLRQLRLLLSIRLFLYFFFLLLLSCAVPWINKLFSVSILDWSLRRCSLRRVEWYRFFSSWSWILSRICERFNLRLSKFAEIV